MGRSVSYPSGAHVAFALWDAGWIEDDDDPDTRHFDQLAAQDDWDFVVEDFREQVLNLYPSAWTANGWIGREDRVVAMNRYARFGLSEYCGCIAYWVVLRDDIDAGQEGLAQRWFDRIEVSFKKRFATLVRLGVFSNGEPFFGGSLPDCATPRSRSSTHQTTARSCRVATPRRRDRVMERRKSDGECGDEVAAIQEAHMNIPTTINTMVSPSLLTKISRFSDGGVLAILTEIIQNGRRAGAKRIDIAHIETDRGPVLRIRDDGCGIADPAKFLALGDSGWDENIARSEDPAGMGVFSLAGHHVTVRSHAAELGTAWQVTIHPHAWESGEPLDVILSSLDKGTEIEIDLPEAWARQLEQAVKCAARFCPVPIWFGCNRQPHENFLREAVRIEDWNGCRIGIFADKHDLHREQPRINFHGLTVPCRLPFVSDADGGRGWYAKIDIIDAPDLQLVLPARKEMVQGASLDALREACETAIFRTIAREGYHRLSHAHWLRAKTLGVFLPEAAPWLHAWTPRTAETDRVLLGDRVAGEPMILMPAEPPHIEQCVGRAIASGRPLGATPVHPFDEFAGYRWYDDLPRMLGCCLRIERGEGDVFDYAADGQVPPGLMSGHVDTIAVEFAVRTTHDLDVPVEILSLPADTLIIPADCSTDLEDVTILLSAGCAIKPSELASLLVAACFYPDEDCDADSYHTQQAAFEMQARFAANMLLLGEDAAVLERVREAMREHVSWLIPKDRAIRMHAVNHLVQATFADNDDEAAVSAAE